MANKHLLLALSFWVCLVLSIATPDANSELPLPADDEWRFLTFEQRHSAMTFLVHPAMMERFQTFYKTAVPELTCESCHGPNAEAAGYDIANTEIPALDPKRVRDLYLPDAKLNPEQIFKRDNITPTMARLMGVPKYDPQTGLGFSCFGCHPREQ